MMCITASCVISDHTVYKNGRAVYECRGGDQNMDKDFIKDAGVVGGTGVSEFLFSVYQHAGLNYPRFYKMDHLSKLGWLTAEILLADSFDAAHYRPEETGLVLSNANSSLDTDLKYYESVNDIPSPSLFVYTLPNIMTGEICIRNGFKGENAFFIAERFDASLIVQYVSDLMDHDILKVCICGWVDLLGEEYKSALYLIENEGRGNSSEDVAGNIRRLPDVDAVRRDVGTYPIPFTTGAVNKIFQGENE